MGKVTAFKSSNLSSPSAVITGSAQFNQLGAYVTVTSYDHRDVIIASSTAAAAGISYSKGGITATIKLAIKLKT